MPAVNGSKTLRTRFGCWPPAGSVLTFAGCSGQQHVLDPRGPAAAAIANFSWVLFAAATLIFIGVVGLLLYALLRDPMRRRRINGNTLILAGGVIFPIVTLSILLFFVFRISGALVEADENRMVIEVTARRWWWEFTYLNPSLDQRVTTANELHIPVGRQVELQLRSTDVIHTFWVPNLGGKRDMIPGVTNTLLLQADESGVFRGQCNEFCGAQHALMALEVVASPEAEFETWLEHQRQPASEPADEQLLEGQSVFLLSGCALCHTVRGTEAFGQNGPDLTHFGSRRLLAAGVLTNTQENREAWISSPQHIKPENLMPDINLTEDSLRALALWLGSLE